jgi:RNA polymerase sigma-70 factor (ECF subfamily)
MDSRRGDPMKGIDPCGRMEKQPGHRFRGGKLKSAPFLACQATRKRGTKNMKRQKSVNWMKDLRNAARSRDSMSTILGDERGTSSSLLRQIKNLSNAPGWTRFYETYGPLVERFATKFGLTAAEREDVIQNTMIQVAKNIPSFDYDRQRGSFKSWLFRSAKWKILDILRARPKNTYDYQRGIRGDDESPPLAWEPSVSIFQELWDVEWQQQLLRDALDIVQKQVCGEHFQIFCQNVLEEIPASQVAQMVGVRTAHVHLIKYRIGRLIKKQLTLLQRQENE